MKFLWGILWFSWTAFILCQNSYKYCVNQYRTIGRACQVIQKGNTQVICILVSDSTDCALKLQRKEVDFAIFSAEDALFVSKFINEDVRVIGEIRNRDRINATFAFQTVILVRETFNSGFSGLQSSNYCHVGFGDGHFWTDRILKEFESLVVPRKCGKDSSNVQLEIASLAEFFKASCRPGEWALDNLLDKKLKKKHPTLCALCDSPARCSYNEDFQGSHKEALACLTEKGDVAYAALQFVEEYFGLVPGFESKANVSDFKCLCRDATYKPLTAPCSWIKQPWPLVVALKEKASDLKLKLPTFLCKPSQCREEWQKAFTGLFQSSTEIFIPTASGEPVMTDVLKEARKIPQENEGNVCQKVVRLCTKNSAEYLKCQWLQQAVLTRGIEPRLNCVQSHSSWSCFDLIKKNQADIVGIDSDHSFIAKSVFNLSAVMYEDNVFEGNYMVLPIIRVNSSIKSFSDFKGKRACFPEYNGLVWNSFIVKAKNVSLLPSKCPHARAVAEFFNGACAPGGLDANHKDYNISFPNSLCSLCIKKNNSSKDDCEANLNNKYYGDEGAFSCVVDDVADVAFVNYRNLFSKENEDFMRKINRTNYQILCNNGTLIPLLNAYQINENCAMSYGVGAEIVSRSSITKYEKRDITELLLKMDDRFGEILSSFDNSIQMYGQFNGISGLIFKETTIDLVSDHDQSNQYVNSFVELKNAANVECHENSAPQLGISKLILLISFLFSYKLFT